MATILSRKYLNIQDHLLNPTFYEPTMRNSKGRVLNRWCNFWNILGARCHTNYKCGYTCVVCGEPIRKQDKTYRVCRKHHVQYARDVRLGRITKPATFEVYTVA